MRLLVLPPVVPPALAPLLLLLLLLELPRVPHVELQGLNGPDAGQRGDAVVVGRGARFARAATALAAGTEVGPA